MAWIGPVIGGVASIAGSLINSSSQRSTNSASIGFSQMNQDWMERMSNTAEQRHVADLKAAGLNPALAYQTSAPVPGAAPMPNISSPRPGDALINSASSIANLGLIAAQTDKTRAEASSAASQSVVDAKSIDDRLSTLKWQSNQVFQSARDLEASSLLKESQGDISRLDAHTRQQLNALQVQIQELDVRRSQLGLPRLENDAAWQKAHPNLAPWVSSGAADFLLNSAKGAMPLIPK